jgi:hypothetical protein
MSPPSHPHEVNPYCATCAKDCKQPAFVKVLECALYEKIPKAKVEGEEPKA